MNVIHKPKFIIKIGEHLNIFSWINQFISRVQNFISLHLKEKSMRYGPPPKSKHQNLKSPIKKSRQAALHGGIEFQH